MLGKRKDGPHFQEFGDHLEGRTANRPRLDPGLERSDPTAHASGQPRTCQQLTYDAIIRALVVEAERIRLLSNCRPLPEVVFCRLYQAAVHWRRVLGLSDPQSRPPPPWQEIGDGCHRRHAPVT